MELIRMLGCSLHEIVLCILNYKNRGHPPSLKPKFCSTRRLNADTLKKVKRSRPTTGVVILSFDSQPGVRILKDREYEGSKTRLYWNGEQYDSRPVAGFFAKAICFIADCVLLLIVAGLLGAFAGEAAGVVAILVILALWIPYFAGSYAYLDRTPGMMLGRLWVIDVNSGKRLSLGRAVVRALILALVQFAGCVQLFWAIAAATNDERRGWHDFAADSLVLSGGRPNRN